MQVYTSYADLVAGIVVGITINSWVPEFTKRVLTAVLLRRQAYLKVQVLPYVRIPVYYCVVPAWWDMPAFARWGISLFGLGVRFILMYPWYYGSLAADGTRWAGFLCGLLAASFLGLLWRGAPGKPGPVANDGLSFVAAFFRGLWTVPYLILQHVWRRQWMTPAKLEVELYTCLASLHIPIFLSLLTLLAPELSARMLKLVEVLPR